MYLSQVCIYILKFLKKDLQDKERMLILTPPEFINNFKKVKPFPEHFSILWSLFEYLNSHIIKKRLYI